MLPIHATFYICPAFVHEIPLVFLSEKKCLSWREIQNPEKPLSFAPESLQMSLTYIYTSEAKTCALRCLKTSR